LLESEHRVDHIPSAVDQTFGCLGRLDGVGRTVEELLTKVGFEFLEAPTQSRLGDVVFLRGLDETPQPKQRLEVLKLSELHPTAPAFFGSNPMAIAP